MNIHLSIACVCHSVEAVCVNLFSLERLLTEFVVRVCMHLCQTMRVISSRQLRSHSVVFMPRPLVRLTSMEVSETISRLVTFPFDICALTTVHTNRHLFACLESFFCIC